MDVQVPNRCEYSPIYNWTAHFLVPTAPSWTVELYRRLRINKTEGSSDVSINQIVCSFGKWTKPGCEQGLVLFRSRYGENWFFEYPTGKFIHYEQFVSDKLKLTDLLDMPQPYVPYYSDGPLNQMRRFWINLDLTSTATTHSHEEPDPCMDPQTGFLTLKENVKYLNPRSYFKFYFELVLPNNMRTLTFWMGNEHRTVLGQNSIMTVNPQSYTETKDRYLSSLKRIGVFYDSNVLRIFDSAPLEGGSKFTIAPRLVVEHETCRDSEMKGMIAMECQYHTGFEPKGLYVVSRDFRYPIEFDFEAFKAEREAKERQEFLRADSAPLPTTTTIKQEDDDMESDEMDDDSSSNNSDNLYELMEQVMLRSPGTMPV